MYRLSTLVTLLVLLLPSPGFAQTVTASEIAEIVHQLRAIGIPDQDSLYGFPPAVVPRLLCQLSRQLGTLLEEILNDPQALSKGSDLWDAVTFKLEAAGWTKIPEHKYAAYGELQSIDMDPTVERPDLLVVATQLWIPCGSDGTVYVFERADGRWKMVLAGEADHYEDISGAQGGLHYGLSNVDDGAWFLVTANIPPWCTSTIRSIRYQVLRPGLAPAEPLVILKRREPLNLNFEPPFRLQVQSGWFSIVRGAYRDLDTELGVFISRWKIVDSTAIRLHPLSLDPEDFLDSWAQLPWDEAKRWIQGDETRLAAWHSTLSGLADGSTEIEFVQPCPSSGKESWQIGLEIERKGHPKEDFDRLYVTVVKENGIFRVQSVGPTRPPGCPDMTPPKMKDFKLPEF